MLQKRLISSQKLIQHYCSINKSVYYLTSCKKLFTSSPTSSSSSSGILVSRGLGNTYISLFSSKLKMSTSTTTKSTAAADTNVKIGVIQMTSTNNVQQNIDTCTQLIQEAKSQDVKMIFLPEAFDFIASNKDEGKQLADTLDGSTIKHYKDLAKTLNIWISLGGFHERRSPDIIKTDSTKPTPWMSNTHIFINSQGEIVGKYDKIHLFDLDQPVDGVSLKESDAVVPGDKIHEPIDTPIGKIGLGICYDLRFPEFSLRLRQAGADVLTFPSAFTVPTGRAHWEVLLRARAIENQCYVIAAAQVGKHNEKRTSYGHSMIIDPWGDKIIEATEDTSPQLLTGSINLDAVSGVRAKMPVLKHRRCDTYGLEPVSCTIPLIEDAEISTIFGQVIVKKKMIFLEQTYSHAFVNRKCFLPGHVLVTSKRPTDRLKGLTEAETSDLFVLVQRVEKIMGEMLHGTSSTIVVQDGRDAGQTIEHTHVHVVPRHAMDLESNDMIYAQLLNHDKGEVKWREDRDMENECNQIRAHIRKYHSDWLTN